MRPTHEVQEVFRLAESGHTQAEIARAVRIGQATVSRWLRAGESAVTSSPMRRRRADTSRCPTECPLRVAAPAEPYAYLLGQYLGDGTIVHTRRGVHRLFISCCAEYPGIIEEVRNAISAVVPQNIVGQRSRNGAVDVTCYSKHWPCLFPQHGPGHKHKRRISLEPWQVDAALDRHPGPFVRGLVHSDGCRCVNRVTGAGGQRYAYPRYMFSNRSTDIRGLFTEACHRLGIESRPMNRWTVAVSRRDSVALMDELVGPKY